MSTIFPPSSSRQLLSFSWGTLEGPAKRGDSGDIMDQHIPSSRNILFPACTIFFQGCAVPLVASLLVVFYHCSLCSPEDFSPSTSAMSYAGRSHCRAWGECESQVFENPFLMRRWGFSSAAFCDVITESEVGPSTGFCRDVWELIIHVLRSH